MSNRVYARQLQDLLLTKVEVIRDGEGPGGTSPPKAGIFMHTPRRDILEGLDLKVRQWDLTLTVIDGQSHISRSAVSSGHF